MAVDWHRDSAVFGCMNATALSFYDATLVFGAFFLFGIAIFLLTGE